MIWLWSGCYRKAKPPTRRDWSLWRKYYLSEIKTTTENQQICKLPVLFGDNSTIMAKNPGVHTELKSAVNWHCLRLISNSSLQKPKFPGDVRLFLINYILFQFVIFIVSIILYIFKFNCTSQKQRYRLFLSNRTLTSKRSLKFKG